MAQEASQLSTTPPLPGLTLVQDINKIARTLGTDFAGPTDPSALAWAYAMWADTSSGMLKRRNAANTAWVIEGTLFARHAPMLTFSEIAALSNDRGPILCSDMAGDLYIWVSTAYFTGYRNPRSGLWYGGASDTPEAWELLATGGTWTTSNPKHARVIARYREWGRTVASGSWTKGWNHIADLGGGNWKAPDLRDVFQRMSGTDADTANARPVGEHQTDAQQNITGAVAAVARTLLSPATGALVATASSSHSTLNVGTNQNTFDISIDGSLVARTSSETRSANTAVAPVILV